MSKKKKSLPFYLLDRYIFVLQTNQLQSIFFLIQFMLAQHYTTVTTFTCIQKISAESKKETITYSKIYPRTYQGVSASQKRWDTLFFFRGFSEDGTQNSGTLVLAYKITYSDVLFNIHINNNKLPNDTYHVNFECIIKIHVEVQKRLWSQV